MPKGDSCGELNKNDRVRLGLWGIIKTDWVVRVNRGPVSGVRGPVISKSIHDGWLTVRIRYKDDTEIDVYWRHCEKVTRTPEMENADYVPLV